jgi:hypothetical protein
VPPNLKLRAAIRDFRLYEYVPDSAHADTPAPAGSKPDLGETPKAPGP